MEARKTVGPATSKESENYKLALPVIEPSYPMLQFVARYGNVIAAVIAGVLLAVGVAAWALSQSAVWMAAGVVGAIFAYCLMRCLSELVHLIVDTMIPK
jgi:hypothetical protein